MDDHTLMGYMNKLPERCIALIEDIDVALDGTLNRDTPGGAARSHNKKLGK